MRFIPLSRVTSGGQILKSSWLMLTFYRYSGYDRQMGQNDL